MPVAADPSRLHEAHRAGIRRRSFWFSRGLLCLALAAAAGPVAELLAGPLRGALRDVGRGSGPDLPSLLAGLSTGLLGLLALLATAAAIHTLSALLQGTLGAVDPRLARRPDLARAASHHHTPGLIMVSVLLVGVTLAIHRGVLAGAARAADASPAALTALWSGWSVKILMTAGILAIAAGILELGVDEQRRRKALQQTPEELRESLRERGHRRS